MTRHDSRHDFKVQLGQNIREARRKLGMTQEEVGLASGMKRSHISHFEAGRRCPDVLSLAAISKAIGTPIEKLLPNA